MQDRDIWGKPVLHHVDPPDVVEYLKKLVIEDNEVCGGKPLSKKQIEFRLNGSEAARSIIVAIGPHNRAHDDYDHIQARLDKKEREFANAKSIASNNLISNERAYQLGGEIIDIKQEADTAWDGVLSTNGVLYFRFQADHSRRPGLPVDGEC